MSFYIFRSSSGAGCHICGDLGHKRRDCPNRPKDNPKSEKYVASFVHAYTCRKREREQESKRKVKEGRREEAKGGKKESREEERNE